MCFCTFCAKLHQFYCHAMGRYPWGDANSFPVRRAMYYTTSDMLAILGVQAYAARCSGLYAPNLADVRELVTLLTGILSLLATSTSDPIISRVPEIVAMVSACPVVCRRPHPLMCDWLTHLTAALSRQICEVLSVWQVLARSICRECPAEETAW